MIAASLKAGPGHPGGGKASAGDQYLTVPVAVLDLLEELSELRTRNQILQRSLHKEW